MIKRFCHLKVQHVLSDRTYTNGPMEVGGSCCTGQETTLPTSLLKQTCGFMHV